MAITDFIDRIQLGSSTNQIAIGSSAYGVCSTVANEAAKTVSIAGFALNSGTTIHVKFDNANTAESPTLNVNNTGAKGIVIYGSTSSGTDEHYTSWQAGAILTLTYDGTNWVQNYGFNEAEISNTDIYVNVKARGTTKAYLLATTTSPTSSSQAVESVAETGVYLDTTAGYLCATKVFSGGNEVLTSFTETDPTVPSWAKATNKPSYTASEVGALADDAIATYNTIGGIKPWYSHTVASIGPTAGSNDSAITVNAIQSESGRYYAIESDSNGRLFVNVPWTTPVTSVAGLTGAITKTDLRTALDLLNTSNENGIAYYSNTTGTFASTSAGSDGYILIGKGANAAPAWQEILPVVHGGTGASSFTDNCVIIPKTTDGIQAFESTYLKITKDNNDHLTLTHHAQNKNITIEANGSGTVNVNSTTGTLTVSSNYGSLTLQGGAANATAQSTLELGNSAEKTEANQSEGKIVIYSTGSKTHTIISDTTANTSDYTHYLSNATGYLVQAPSASAVNTDKQLVYIAANGIATASNASEGSPTQPVYLNNGTLTELTYTANRLYYSASEDSFAATNHYATTTELFINKIPAQNETISDTLYVNGSTTINGNLNVTGTTTLTGNITPSATATYSLGTGGNRWSAAYIGTENTYGDPYLPIYWNNGVPAYLSGVVQYKEFTIDSGETSVVLESAAYNQLNNIHTYVLQIVVKTGANNLNDVITWTSQQKSGSTTLGQVILSTAATSGAVSGYIITARGCSLDPNT